MKKRIVSAVLTAGLLGLAPMAAAPANATETLTTTTTVTVQAPLGGATYGDTVDVIVAVKAQNGATAYNGTTTLWMSTPASPTWVEVRSDRSGAFVVYEDIRVTGKTAFKATYSGYTATTTSEDNYVSSESTAKGVAVSRKVKATNPRGTIAKIKVVAPAYKNKPVVVQKKKGKRWVKFRTYRTNRYSVASFSLPAPRTGTWYWRITVPGNQQFTPYVVGFKTYRY